MTTWQIMISRSSDEAQPVGMPPHLPLQTVVSYMIRAATDLLQRGARLHDVQLACENAANHLLLLKERAKSRRR